MPFPICMDFFLKRMGGIANQRDAPAPVIVCPPLPFYPLLFSSHPALGTRLPFFHEKASKKEKRNFPRLQQKAEGGSPPSFHSPPSLSLPACHKKGDFGQMTSLSLSEQGRGFANNIDTI